MVEVARYMCFFLYVRSKKDQSQNRRGLAHFAESSEQNVPVPFPEAVLTLVLLTNRHCKKCRAAWEETSLPAPGRPPPPTRRSVQRTWYRSALPRTPSG